MNDRTRGSDGRSRTGRFLVTAGFVVGLFVLLGVGVYAVDRSLDPQAGLLVYLLVALLAGGGGLYGVTHVGDRPG